MCVHRVQQILSAGQLQLNLPTQIMANKKKEKPPKAEAEKTQIATTEEPTEESDALAVEALLELAPKTFLGRVRYNVLGILGFLSQEELEAEELAQRLREEKEAEDAAYEALPWIQKCGSFREDEEDDPLKTRV